MRGRGERIADRVQLRMERTGGGGGGMGGEKRATWWSAEAPL